MRIRSFAFSAALLIAGFSQYALANTPIVEWEKRQGQEGRLQSFGPDLLGDQIDPQSGALVFETTDIAIPGNSHLEVAIRRRRTQGFFYPGSTVINGSIVNVLREFGDFTLLAPRIDAISALQPWTGARCTSSMSAAFPTVDLNPGTYSASQYSEGVKLDVPGAGVQQVLWTSSTYAIPQFPNGATGTRHVTTDNWRIDCVTSSGTPVIANDGGQGFFATAPNGDTYRFDRFISVPYTELPSMDGGWITRHRNFLAATQVKDASGNTVDYTYDSAGRLTQISANDGRVINIAYQPGSNLILAVTANGRMWIYSYSAAQWPEFDDNQQETGWQPAVLRTVTLPDGTFWSYDLDGMSASPGRLAGCPQKSQTLTVKHPYGAQGTFRVAEVVHRQGLDSYTTAADCHDPANIDPRDLFWPPGSRPAPTQVTTYTPPSMAVVSKVLTAPGAPPATWTFTYESDGGAGTAGEGIAGTLDYRTNRTSVQEPGNRHVTYYHYWNDEDGANSSGVPLPAGNPIGGKLAGVQVRQGNATGALLETTTYGYVLEYRLGETVAQGAFTSFAMTNPARTISTTINRLGDTFTTANNYNSTFSSSNYSWGFPTTVTEISSTAPSLSRVTDTVYTYNASKWVLGLPSTVTRNGKLFDSYTYDSFGRVSTHSKFGALAETFTYSASSGQEGTVATYKDALNSIWTLSNWKRGMPQSIVRPSSLGTFTRVVDNNGWVTSETDYRGSVFNFGYNSMGWLTLIDRPAPYNDTTIAPPGLGTGVVVTSTRGAKKVTVDYDGYLRPVLVKTEAMDGSAVTNYVKTSYDGLGRTTFQSWPSTSASPIDGVNTAYDALSRPLSVAENVSPYATTTTQYLSGGQTRVTDPANAIVTTTARAFGDPNAAEPMTILDAMGATTTMTRDIYGNVLTLAQSGTQNGFTASVTRNFWYDNELRLCRHHAPEFGDEVFEYDALNRITITSRGHSPGSGCAPADVAIGQRYQYDALGRRTYILFAAGTPDIAYSYDPNGNMTRAARGAATWDYTYTALDGLATEQLVIDGRTYLIGHAYNGNGEPTMRSNSHSGVTVDFSANAYGQPRQASVGATNYVSGATYHVNGLLNDATYLNGHIFDQTLNTRQLPDQLKTAKPGGANAVWLTHNYDARRKVSSVVDSDGAGDNEGRSFTYDPNGRLLTANGPWGTGSYVYDALGNIRNRTEGSNSVSTMNYDTTNRVSTAVIFGTNRTFAYDARGNVTSNGNYTFAYDFANQPVSQTGAANATFAYDGNLKRVKEVRGGKTIYTVYSKLTGGLVYRDQATDNTRTDYVSVGGAALRLKKIGAGALTPEYTHFDAQGSAIAATDASGAIAWRESYRPYGRTRLDPAANDNNTGYTGHLEDSSTGLVYMQARYYAPAIGRFYSPDPIGYQDQLNLYAYVANDPVNKVDPTGEYADLAIEAVSIGLGVKSFSDNLSSGNIGAAAVDAVGVAVDTVLAVVPVAPGAAGIGIKVAREGGQKLSQRAATREAKRQAGIPTSQQAKSQTSATAKDGTKVGRQQTHETPKPGGGTQEKSVQVSRDQVGSHAGQPQIEAGNVKAGGQTDSAGRPRIENENKVRVDFDPDR